MYIIRITSNYVQAGIDSEDVLIVSEAEAVVTSFKLQYLSTKSRHYEPEIEFKFSKGSKLLVLDCGGKFKLLSPLFDNLSMKKSVVRLEKVYAQTEML